MERNTLGQRSTRQRDVIAEVIRTAAGPLTVQEILARAQADVHGLGVATVYRTLKLLQEGEQVRTVILPTGETRYEAAGLGHHHHFHCRVCDEVYDLDACPVRLPESRAIAPGFVVESHELTFYGTCRRCA
ncbi:MAG: ferric uptake regulator, Fur family [Gemmatimonadetes bacterium]|nr:ferric uptake regulator, Fur family [Gemmatimonadota bacterium]